jgi:ATP-binding cassette subfamily C protein
LTVGERLKVLALIVLMVIGALMELVGLGLVMPVIAVLAKPELMVQNKFLRVIHEVVNPSSDHQFILLLCAVVAVVYLGKNLFLLFLTRRQARFVFTKAAELGSRLFELYLSTPYSYHLRRNSSVFMNNITMIGKVAFNVLMPAMMLATEAVVIVVIFGTMLFFAPLLAMGLAFVSGLLAILLHFIMRTYNSNIGVRLNRHRLEITRDIMQTFEGIKECKLLNCESVFSSRHAAHQRLLRQAEAEQHVAGQIPRFSIEAFVVVTGMGALAALVLCGVATGSIFLRLSFVAIAMIRLMPSLSRINYNLSTMRHTLPAFDAIMHDLDGLHLPALPKAPALSFSQSIRLENITFTYEGSDSTVVSGFSLEIPRNSSLALVGQTGCGKTTLLDIVLGLLKPSQGRILVDGRDIEENLPSWQRRIGYVPQVIHLMDESLRINVAFGVPTATIDDAKVRRCLETAQLWNFVESLPEGLETIIGERGVRLSGGQRQRLGIARALYHDPEVLALDEATSALDSDTEKAVVEALKTLHGKFTIIMIAHRLTTVQGCDNIVNLKLPYSPPSPAVQASGVPL